MLPVIILSALLEFDYHMLKIDAGTFWKMPYAHLVFFGLTLVLGDQVNDCSNSRAKNKSGRFSPTQLRNGDISV